MAQKIKLELPCGVKVKVNLTWFNSTMSVDFDCENKSCKLNCPSRGSKK